MRRPLLVLLCTYAISVLGMVLIPGMDNQGKPWRMDFFHAFYFVSFMGSTIGFGEIPYPFTDAQRMWTTVTIYATVVSWLYGIGTLLSIVQEPAFRRFVNENMFTRAVRRIKEPFYIICGYGDTGSLLVRVLTEHGIRSVVLDIRQDRIDDLDSTGLTIEIPGLCADASNPNVLIAAGLKHHCCEGVVAVTDVDQVNLTIAITSKLLVPDNPVICRAESQDTIDNMASFGTNFIINPFDTFADRFAMLIHSPSMYLIEEWMISTHLEPLREPVMPPNGKWIICGYGRFGKAVDQYLQTEGQKTVIIESNPEQTGGPIDAVVGRGTEAVTLHQAKITEAVGIVAGTDNDINNLSIIMTAQDLNPGIFSVARQSHRRHDPIFKAAKLDLIMQPGEIIAHKILALIMNPLLADFLQLIQYKDREWANMFISRISGLVEDEAPDNWIIEITNQNALAICEALQDGLEIQINHLLCDPRDRSHTLAALPLLLKRDDEKILLPEESMPIHMGDKILFGGLRHASTLMYWTTNNLNVLEYIYCGIERPSGYVWRWFANDDKS